MKNLLRIMIFLLFISISVEVYSQSLDDLNKTEDYDLDIDSDDFNFDSNRANDFLTNPNLMDTSRYNTSEQQSLISNFTNNASSYLNSASGSSETGTMTTLDGSYEFGLDVSCMPSETDLADLTISNGKPVTISLNVVGNNSFSISNIKGVCENKITVCDKNENRRICNNYIGFQYTNGKNEGIKYDCADGDTACNTEKTKIETDVCYDLDECMSWKFAVDESGDNVTIQSAAGSNCTELLTTGITVGQKDYIVSHIESVLATYSKSGLSQTSTDDNKNNTTYKQMSYSDEECFGYSSSFGSGYTNLSDMYAYYNENKSNTNISDSERSEKYESFVKSTDNGMVNTLESQKTIDDYDNLSARLESASNSLQTNGFDNIANVLENLNVGGSIIEDISELAETCYNPTCTVDLRYYETTLGSDGNTVAYNTISTQRVFRQCELSSVTVGTATNGNYYDNGTGREYTCPIYNEDGIEETIVYNSDGSDCSCDNEYEQSENLKNLAVAMKLAEVINSAICPKDDQDNETIDAIVEKRAECMERCDGEGNNYANCYNECMSETVYGLEDYGDEYQDLEEQLYTDFIECYTGCDSSSCKSACIDEFLEDTEDIVEACQDSCPTKTLMDNILDFIGNIVTGGLYSILNTSCEDICGNKYFGGGKFGNNYNFLICSENCNGNEICMYTCAYNSMYTNCQYNCELTLYTASDEDEFFEASKNYNSCKSTCYDELLGNFADLNSSNN